MISSSGEGVAYLVHGQIDASVGNDAQDVGDVALVKRFHSLPLQDLLGTVKHSRVLARLPQRQTGLQHLQRSRFQVSAEETGPIYCLLLDSEGSEVFTFALTLDEKRV